jgi:hypothetical protein
MTMTLTELQEYLKSNASEEDLLDVLHITTEDLVEFFDSRIDERYDEVLTYFGLDENDSED